MKNNVTISVLLYYVGVFFTVFSAHVTNSSYMFRNTGLNSVARYAALFFLLSSILVKNRWEIKSLVAVGLLTALGTLVAIISNDKALILYVLMVSAIGKINPTVLIKRIAALNLIFLITIISSSLIGIIPNDTFTHYDRTAYCLGYYYYSTCAYHVFFLTIVGYFLIFGKFRKIYEILYIAFSIFANFVIYKVCTVRLTFYCYLIFLALIIIYKNTNLFKDNRFYRIVATWMFPCAGFATIWLSLNFNKFPFMNALDSILNARFSFNYQAFQRYSISFLGNHIETHAEEWNENWHNLYFYIDSGYIDTLLGNGVIIFILAIICYTLISRMAVRKNNYKLFVWCVIICVFSIVNNVFLSVCTNPLLLFSIAAINNERIEQRAIRVRRRGRAYVNKGTQLGGRI